MDCYENKLENFSDDVENVSTVNLNFIMDILNNCLEVWKQVEEDRGQIFQQTIVIDNEYIGKNNNCSSVTSKSIIILDGKHNQLHFIKQNNETLVHQVVLMTPQPIYKYCKIELSLTKQFIALIGIDTVGIVEVTNISLNKSCKKVKEIFSAKDDIISVKWYPQMLDCIVILTKYSIHIFQCRSNMKVVSCFQYYLNNLGIGNSKIVRN